MKKISIILSAALLAATFALAGCSNVTELNGSEWDTYKANANGQSLSAANTAASTGAYILHFANDEFYDISLTGTPEDKIPEKISAVVKTTITAPTADKVYTISEGTAGALYELKVTKGTVYLGDTYVKVEFKRKDTASNTKFKDFSSTPSFTISVS